MVKEGLEKGKPDFLAWKADVFEKIKKIADVVVYTDLYNIRQTINIVKQRLQLTEKMNCISKERWE